MELRRGDSSKRWSGASPLGSERLLRSHGPGVVSRLSCDRCNRLLIVWCLRMSHWIRGFYIFYWSSGSCGHRMWLFFMQFFHFFPFEKLIQPRCRRIFHPLRALPLGDWMSEGSAVDVIRTHCSRELKNTNYSHLIPILLKRSCDINHYYKGHTFKTF